MKTAYERPILFSGAMVRAILNGSKTQTRRVVKPQPEEGYRLTEIPMSTKGGEWALDRNPSHDSEIRLLCPYGKPGDRLWVREAVCLRPEGYGYRADNDPTNNPTRWIPSIHMPREASRITLEITDVRVERLQDISEADAEAEGVAVGDWITLHGQFASLPMSVSRGAVTARESFQCLWNGLNGRRGYNWESNPFVWVVTFKRLEVGR